MSPSDRIERPINLFLALIVLGSIGAVAYADFLVTSISLGYLYVLPLALSGFVFHLRISLALVFFCFVLQDWFGPFAHNGWQHIVRNLLTLIAFVAVVVVVNRLVQQRTSLTDLVRQQRDELAREIDLAAHVQLRMLPSGPPVVHGFDIAGRMIAARTAGGDYFDYLNLPTGQLGLVIADVSGKGVSAALLMSSVKKALWAGAPRLTVLRPDNVTQILELNEETSLRKGQGSITMADIQVGDHVMARGAVQNDIFVPKGVTVINSEHWKRMQEIGAQYGGSRPAGSEAAMQGMRKRRPGACWHW